MLGTVRLQTLRVDVPPSKKICQSPAFLSAVPPSMGPYLFIYFDLKTAPFIPKGYVAKGRQKRRPAAVLDRSAQTNEIRRPPRCAVRKTRGQEYPFTKKSRNDKKEKNNLTLSSTHLFSFPGYPLAHPGRVCPILIRSVSHRPSHPRQF